jgi:hypothetical protein
MFENGCYLRRQKRFKIPKMEKGGDGGGRSGRKEGRSRHHNNNSSSQQHHADSSTDHQLHLGGPDVKKSSGGGLKSSSTGDLFGGGGGGHLPPLTGPGTLIGGGLSSNGGLGSDSDPLGGGLPVCTKVEKHEYKYGGGGITSLQDKYGVDPSDMTTGGGGLHEHHHLVLPAAAPLGGGKHLHSGLVDHYGSPVDSLNPEDKYQTPDMSHLDQLHSRYALPEGLLGLSRPLSDGIGGGYSSATNPFSIHRLLPGPGSPGMHSASNALKSATSATDLSHHYGDYGGGGGGLQSHHHGLHSHESMYYNPPLYQVRR